ncbi:MAG: anaerobic ribonucleoside-triphosphate reductase activating protein [Clostridiaceae bacterium]|jgi:pyruvate formate lyase activating enzyme|nr:anaerobic ribonucleoside-triphosphate reductase activating protein [Clostridiaceae bacterium]
MNIAGFNPNSFVDYPGNIAAVVFTAGCDMRCWYCHNRHITSSSCPLLDETEVLDKIRANKALLDGVVITGGEPTLQADLAEFIKKIRSEGLLVKLDTNGKHPEVLKPLLDAELIDYVAMDIKTPLKDYDLVTPTVESEEVFRDSIRLIISSGVNHEFRTTFFPQLTADDIGEIGKEIEGARAYFLQRYNNVEGFDFKPHGDTYFKLAAEKASRHVRTFVR